MEPLRVLLVDEHRLLRAGLRALLRDSSGLEVVGEASSGTEALALIETLNPEILITDIGMPGMNGIELTERACKLRPDLKVLILTRHANEEYWREMSTKLGSGADRCEPRTSNE